MCPFQCDLCHFRNITGSDPGDTVKGHQNLLDDIRRACLDSFWGRAKSTVKNNMYELRRLMRICGAYDCEGLRPLGPLRGPFPVEDNWGVLLACAMLRRSLDPGRNALTVQFDTVRGLRTAVTNYTSTTRFVAGCHARMGDTARQDQALTADVLQGLLDLLEIDWMHPTESDLSPFELALLGAALTIGYSTALRGEEYGFCLLKETAQETVLTTQHPRIPHVMVVMKGTFKGGAGIERRHRFPLVLESNSGLLRNETWLVRLLGEYLDYFGAEDALSGPLFWASVEAEAPSRISDFNPLFHLYLSRLQAASPHLFGPRIEVESAYSFRRSLRRGSTTHARNRGVKDGVIEANQRWKKQERAGNRDASLGMLETYTDAEAALELKLVYSQSL